MDQHVNKGGTRLCLPGVTVTPRVVGGTAPGMSVHACVEVTSLDVPQHRVKLAPDM